MTTDRDLFHDVHQELRFYFQYSSVEVQRKESLNRLVCRIVGHGATAESKARVASVLMRRLPDTYFWDAPELATWICSPRFQEEIEQRQ